MTVSTFLGLSGLYRPIVPSVDDGITVSIDTGGTWTLSRRTDDGQLLTQWGVSAVLMTVEKGGMMFPPRLAVESEICYATPIL